MLDIAAMTCYTNGTSHGTRFLFLRKQTPASTTELNIVCATRPIRKTACREKQLESLVGRAAFKRVGGSMKPFDAHKSNRIDYAIVRLENSRGLARLYWRVVLAWREYQGMGWW